MILHEITVSFQDNSGDWEEPETYKIVSGKSNLDEGILSASSPLAKKALEAETNQTLLLPTNKKFRLLSKIIEQELEDYVNNIDSLQKEDKNSLLSLSKKIPILLAQSIEVPQHTAILCEFIVSIKLEYEDLLSCKEWLEQLKEYGINLNESINKINAILDKQQGIEIKDIRDPHLLNTLSQLYIELYATQRAKNILLHSLSIDPDNSYTLVQLGKLHRITGSYHDGVNYYKKAIKIDGNTYAYNGLGALYRAMDKHDFSIKCYRKSLEVDPSNSNQAYAYKGMGAVYFDLELYNEGAKYYELAGMNSQRLLKKLYNEAINNKLTDKALKLLNLLK